MLLMRPGLLLLQKHAMILSELDSLQEEGLPVGKCGACPGGGPRERVFCEGLACAARTE